MWAGIRRFTKKRIMFIVVIVIVLAGITFVAVKTYIHYSNPLMDVTASYYEKTVNSTTVNVGDIVEVKVFVYWHGYVFPEFKRDVKIVDPFSEDYFALASGSNVYEYKGRGRSCLFNYSLRVVGGEGLSIELPKPRLYLDSVEIPLNGTISTLNISSKT